MWNLSVHNTQLPFDSVRGLDKSELEICLRSPVSRKRDQKLPLGLFVLFLLPPTVQLEDVPQHNTQIPVQQRVQNLLVLVLLCSWDSSGSSSTVGNSDSKDYSSSSFPVSTSARHSPTDLMSSPTGTASRFRVVFGLTSALLCHTRFPTLDSPSQNTARHHSHCGFSSDFTSRFR